MCSTPWHRQLHTYSSFQLCQWVESLNHDKSRYQHRVVSWEL